MTPRSSSTVHPTTAGSSIDARLAQIFRATDRAVLIVDAHGCVEWVNEPFTRFFGLAAAEVIGKALAQLPRMPGIDAETVKQVGARLARGETARLELGVDDRQGRSRRLAIEVQPVAGGGVVAIATDITDRWLAQLALAESEARYRSLVELSPDPIVVHQDGCIVFASPAALRALGAQQVDEVVGRPIQQFVHPDFLEVVAERVRKMLEQGQPACLLEEAFVRLDGGIVHAEVVAAPIRWGDRPAIQLVARDLSERQRAEAERRQLEARLAGSRRLLDLSGFVVDLSAAIECAVGRVRGDVSFVFDLVGDLPRVEVDILGLRTALHELVRSAALSLGAEGGRLRIRTGQLETDAVQALVAAGGAVEPKSFAPPGACVFVEISDSGSANRSHTRRRVATAAAIELARAHGGALHQEAGGTATTLILPVLGSAPDPGEPAAGESRGAARSRRARSGVRRG